ncbi:RING finger protein 113A [Geosmithia morbida]|uniref:Pre-mRNA-splicing factor CWC24 n=1 Tax=Geosmithia morbida TaxID=1094350 RepID=A0A9P5CYX3_9HYPO|nr:RING finger protein 113A [Geosmithia morbida]KAF4119852.1 RING finger protein 113A [Geosmithia morbida]
MTDAEAKAASESPAAPVAMFKKRGAKGKANIRKRPATPPPVAAAAAADSDSDSDMSSSEGESGQMAKRRKKTAAVTASSKNSNAAGGISRDEVLSTTAFMADRSGITNSNDATKHSNWYDEDTDGALSAKNLLGSTRGSTQGQSQTQARAQPDGTYKGLANQTSFIQKNPDAPQRSAGPMKASSNVRTITFMDYKPDVCKDYKQTGFCGYGDNCIFLHSREDMKQGWQLDREWEKVTKGGKSQAGTVVASANRDGKAGAADEEDEDEAFLEKIPFACVICKQSYKEPIATRCGHYFCEACALKRYRKDPTCAACGASTKGVFNAAKRLKKLLDKKRERAERKRQEAIEAGEEVDEAVEAAAKGRDAAPAEAGS